MATLSQLANPKRFTLESAVKWRMALKEQGRRLVMTNGCFDLLHPGHIYFLQEARKLGDVLFVFLNSARSVSALKGPTRPILGDDARAYALAALACVDAMAFFDTPRLVDEILAMRPDVYVKAADYTLEKLDPNERSTLDQVGAQIRFAPFLDGFSTTQLVEKICAAYKG